MHDVIDERRLEGILPVRVGFNLVYKAGEYTLGYCYENVKTHKSGHKLRPIIS